MTFKAVHRAIYLKILVLCGLIVFSSMALYPIQAALSRSMNNLKTGSIKNLEEVMGMEIRYASIRPAFFGSFEIRNLRFYKEGRSFLSVSRASVKFSFIKLLTGNKTAIHTVYLDRPALRMDLKRDKDIFAGFSGRQESDDIKEETDIIQKIAQFLPKKVNYVIRDCSVLLVDGNFVYKVDGMNAVVKGDKSDILFDSSFDAEIRYSGFKDRSIILNSAIDVKSAGISGLSEAKADIVFSSIVCSEQRTLKNPFSFIRTISMSETSFTKIFTMSPFNIGIVYKDNEVNINQMPGIHNLDYSIFYNLLTNASFVRIDWDNYFLGRNIVFSDNYKNASYLLDMAITGGLIYVKNEEGLFNFNINYQVIGDDSHNRISIKANGNNDSLFIDDFYINASEDSVKAGLFQGKISSRGRIDLNPSRPYGNIRIENLSFTGKESINADLRITSEEDKVMISAKNSNVGSVLINDFYINFLSKENDSVIIGSLLCQDNSAVFIDAVYNNTIGDINAMINFESYSLYNIAGLFYPFIDAVKIPVFLNNFAKKNKIDSEVYLYSNFENIIYNATNIVIKNEKVLGKMSLAGTDRQFNLSQGVFYLNENELLISANSTFNNSMDISFALNASYQNISWNIDGQILDRTTIIIRDPNGLHIYGNVSSTAAVSGYIEGIDYPVPVNGSPVYLNFYSTLRFTNREFWSFDLSYFEARDINTPIGENNLRISGSADQDGASFREIIFNDNLGMLFGNADFLWDIDFSYLQFFINMTDGYDDGEAYFFDGMLRNEHFRLISEINNMHINRFLGTRSPVLATAQANITWDSINSFNANVDVTSFYAEIKNNKINASGGLSFTNDTLILNDINFKFAEINAIIPAVQLSRTEGTALVQLGVNGLVQEKDFDLKASFTADFRNIDSWINIAQALDLFNANLFVENFHYGDVLYKDTEFILSGNNGDISLYGGVNEMLRLELDNTGNFYLGLSSPLPIRGSFAGTLKDLNLDAHCNYFFIDIQSMFTLASKKSSEVAFGGGFITGKLDIRGPLLNPEFFGTAKGSSFNIQVPNFIAQDIRPVPFNVIAEGYEMTFGPVVTVCGEGGGRTTGWLRFENWIPRNLGIEIAINHDTPIPYNLNLEGFTAEGNASGRLNILYQSEDNDIVEIKGDLLMNETEMGFNELMVERVSEIVESEDQTLVELKITTGNMVEFYWPNKNSPIIRANPEMGTIIFVTADSLARQYSLKGEVNIRSGEIAYIDRNFLIRQGSLVLNENENEFNPILTARAEVRDRIDTGPVTISMIIDNQPLLSFEPVFEAEPSLTQLEIFSLLGQNYNIQGSDNQELSQRFLLSSGANVLAQVASRSDALGQLIYFRQLERTARNFLNLDMLTLRTRFVQNALVDATDRALLQNETETGTVQPDSNTRVGNYLDNTSVSIGKYIGQDMFIQGTVTMKYDEYNEYFGGMTFEPDLGIEWRTPFVSIRWDFFPNNPQFWYVVDNSVTLRWSKSF